MTFPTAKAEGLHSAAPESYKAIRLREMAAMIEAEAPRLVEHTPKLLAHLYIENGALAEDIHGDWLDAKRPCSLGILQYNTCVHHQMNVYRYLEKHPHLKDWREQFRLYLTLIQKKLDKYGNIDTAIASWNFGAAPGYLQKVKRNVAVVESLRESL